MYAKLLPRLYWHLHANIMPTLLAWFLQRTKAFCLGMVLANARTVPTCMQNFCPMPWAKK
jgi:hypothetical protein